MSDKRYDLITIGRISMDLFSLNVGAPFEEIEAFEASIGGSPSNIALCTSRLGLNSALLTAVGDDKVGDFALHYLANDGVDTQFIPRKGEARTGLAVLGVEPPDRFPLVFYRDNPADIHITVDDVPHEAIANSRTLLVSGTALSRGTCRDAVLFAAEVGGNAPATVFIDLDLRPDQWSHPRAFGLNIRTILPHLDVIIGTEEEFFAALSPQPESVMQGKKVTPDEKEQLEQLLHALRERYNGQHTLVVKRGPDGVTIYTGLNAPVNVSGFPVEVVNTVGAGDAFASGLIYGYLQGWDWQQTARLANACGALVVTRHGCAKAMPYLDEVQTFMNAHGA